jgi:hypothetical protein
MSSIARSFSVAISCTSGSAKFTSSGCMARSSTEWPCTLVTWARVHHGRAGLVLHVLARNDGSDLLPERGDLWSAFEPTARSLRSTAFPAAATMPAYLW